MNNERIINFFCRCFNSRYSRWNFFFFIGGAYSNVTYNFSVSSGLISFGIKIYLIAVYRNRAYHALYSATYIFASFAYNIG